MEIYKLHQYTFTVDFPAVAILVTFKPPAFAKMGMLACWHKWETFTKFPSEMCMTFNQMKDLSGTWWLEIDTPSKALLVSQVYIGGILFYDFHVLWKWAGQTISQWLGGECHPSNSLWNGLSLGDLFGQVSHHTKLPTIDPVWITTVQESPSSWKNSRNWVFLPTKDHHLGLFEFWGEISVWPDPAIHPETWRVDSIEPRTKTHMPTQHLIPSKMCNASCHWRPASQLVIT